ncbi:MAG: hypothetical protein ARM1_0051 [Candidatus Micrarchaeota archaeon]|nr:MAG: hypothetical protein ARM1_0051 [Candidatus Micrarchaeota archaeon]
MGMRIQSSIDLLVAYGGALLIVTAALGLLFIIVNYDYIFTPTSCGFSIGFSCDYDYVLQINNSATQVILYANNIEGLYMSSPSLKLQLGNTNYSIGCIPNFIAAGGIVLCDGIIDKGISPGTEFYAKLYLTAPTCFNKNCSDVAINTYSGYMYARATHYNAPVVLPLYINITANQTSLSLNQYAKITIFLAGFDNKPLPGASIVVSSNGGFLSSYLQNTNATGYATVYFHSNTAGSYVINASFYNISKSVVITVS